MKRSRGMIAEQREMTAALEARLKTAPGTAEAPVVIGFSLLALQGIADLIRLPWRPAPDFSHDGEAEFHSDQTEDSRP